MKRVILTAAVLTLGVALATPAMAQRRDGNRGGFPRPGQAPRYQPKFPKVAIPKTVIRTPVFKVPTTSPRPKYTPKPAVIVRVPPRVTLPRPLPYPKVDPVKRVPPYIPVRPDTRPLPIRKPVYGTTGTYPRPRTRVVVNKDYCHKYGCKFTHGHYYKGHDHYHWKYVCWSQKYGCKCYYCPSAACWYYYHPTYQGYYPINYLTVAPPPALAVPTDAPATPTEFTPEELPPIPAPDEVPFGG